MNNSTLQLQRPQGPLSPRQSPGDGSAYRGTPAVSESGRSEETPPRFEWGNPPELGGGAVSPNLDLRSKGRRTTALSIASLNSRGLRGGGAGNRDKLSASVRVMRESKWAVLALQETHESESATARLEAFNARVWAFPNPGTAFSAGTSFLVYTDFLPFKGLQKEDVKHRILIPGRAQLITIQWREGDSIDIVNIYAPNNHQEAIDFYQELRRALRRRPDVVMGDFNHVENVIDRIPQRDTHVDMRNALHDFRSALGLTDGWRLSNPGIHSYTWTSAGLMDGVNHRSRLDRILTSQEMTDRTVRWGHQTSQNISDHDFVFADIINERDPDMGPSRWRMSIDDLNDPHLTEQSRLLLLAAESSMNRGGDPMVVWLQMKTKLRNVFSGRKRQLVKLRSSKKGNLENERDKCKAHPDYATNPQIQRNCEAIEARIATIQEHKTAQAVLTQTARYATLGESVSKYWFSIGKSLMKDSMIRSLKDEDGVPQQDTEAMLEIAATHHETLMMKPHLSETRQHAIDEMATVARSSRISEAAATRLGAPLTQGEAAIAVSVSQRGKAPGEDGIPYEFYKKWMDEFKKAGPDSPKVPSITDLMVRAWNAPSRRTEAPEEYVRGLMALLYKKGDKELAANYRPITLLNTDEKLETKCLATRMGMCLPAIIHPDQAGFVPGRDILDHVKLAKVVAEYCEATEQDGCLVALDQEKAYDRIDHEYLWQILEAYGIPEAFIRRVRALYARATTKIMINRKTSRSFVIERGVRQGDPMSCLLFDLAIEPLAETLRRSPLRGIRLPGTAERLICKLFADDTQLYLSKADSYRQAMEIAETWTIASTAKFNENKTEILPLGRAGYRAAVVRNRTISGTPSQDAVPVGAKVAKDGESLRILGGRVGYNLDIEEVWQPVIDKLDSAAKKWSARSLTMKGRALVCSFLMLSTTQYLMMVNEPSKNLVDRIDKTLRQVAWKGKARGILRLGILSKPKEEGGTGLPLTEARVRASRIMWLKKWRKPPAERPAWTNYLDRLIRANANGTDKPWMKSILDQTWSTKKTRLSKETQHLLKEAATSNLTVDALKMGIRPKSETLVWRTSDSNKTKTEENSAMARRLWLKHGVNTQAGLIRVRSGQHPNCRQHEKCIEAADAWILGLKPKTNMLEQTPKNRWTGAKDNLDLTARRHQRNVENRALGNPVLLDPSVTHHEARCAATRVFAPPREGKDEIAYRQTNLNVAAGTTIVYTDGSADKNGEDNSACGAGLWSETEGISGSVRVLGYPPTNNRGELAAATLALHRAPMNRKLVIRTDSMYVSNFLDGGFKRLEDLGWLNVPNADLLKRSLYLLRRRTAETWIQKVKAHSGIEGNEAADEAAKQALLIEDPQPMDLTVPPQWALEGAKLATLSFHDAYEWSRAAKNYQISERATANLQRYADFVQEQTGNRPSAATLWLSFRDPCIRRQVSDFLWQQTHGRTVCGTFFRHWGDVWTERQFCSCGALETLEHILIGCQLRAWRSEVWQEYRTIAALAEATGSDTPATPQFEEIMTIGLYKTKRKAAQRIHKILVSETAYCIWKLRCDEVIKEERIHPRRAAAALHAALFRRAEVDLKAAKLPDNPLGRRTGFDKTVKAAWAGLVDRVQGKLVWVPRDYG